MNIKKIKQQIKENKILLYMKGSPNCPSCGFSAKAVEIISKYVENFSYIDVLINPDIRVELPKLANWPTFPQLWINGNFIGGCDIIIEMYQNGELKEIINNLRLNAVNNQP
ncbi:Glutaredoxin-4 [Candidatus Mikella endobia]|uniref:Glutaredoxin n=1 Tax=Candidatus Mikella endobia TaxID=1778264 RepID=A0A143WPG3_9ENTR|nr:Grx4 family monothiol glutaredoxin [Candidatus Mikella endobia]CUX95655.1 Glutaredoxin-4 [Candidatus Mikella endobia]